MPMINVTAVEGTYVGESATALLAESTEALLRWEKAEKNAIVRTNTGAYLHPMPAGHVLAGGAPDDVVRIEILTPPGSLTQEQRQGMTADLTKIAAARASRRVRTWVLFRETVDGGWGIEGRAFTNADIAAAVRASAA